MSVLVGSQTRLVVQGITGREGTFHTLRNRTYGTQVVAGVTPGKAGANVEGIPVFDTVIDAVRETGANTSMIFVPPRFAAEAILEAADAGVDLIVCITEGIPVRDMASVHSYLKGVRTTLVGPNCPGVISPGVANVGIIPGEICAPGRVGLVSRSGTLVYQIVHELTQLELGQSTCVGMGGDPVHGIGFIESLSAFQADPDTDVVVMVGEIGGDDEERAAAFIADHVTKPVIGYIAGFEAPPGKRMGHAGAIVTGSKGTAAAKAEALEARRRSRRAHAESGRRAGPGGPGVNPPAPPASPEASVTPPDRMGSAPGVGLRAAIPVGIKGGLAACAIVALAGQAAPLLIDLFGGGLALPTALKIGWFYELAFHRVGIDITAANGGTTRLSVAFLAGTGLALLLLYRAGRAAAGRAGPVFRDRASAVAIVGLSYALPIAVVTAFVRLRLAPGLAFLPETVRIQGVVWQSFVFPALLGIAAAGAGSTLASVLAGIASAGVADRRVAHGARSARPRAHRCVGARSDPAPGTRPVYESGIGERTEGRAVAPGPSRAAVARSVVPGARALDGCVHITPRSRGDALAPLPGHASGARAADAPRGSRTRA